MVVSLSPTSVRGPGAEEGGETGSPGQPEAAENGSHWHATCEFIDMSEIENYVTHPSPPSLPPSPPPSLLPSLPPNQIQMFPPMYIAQSPGQRAFYPTDICSHKTMAPEPDDWSEAILRRGALQDPSNGPPWGHEHGARVNTPRMPNQRMGQQQMGGQVSGEARQAVTGTWLCIY